MHFKTAKKRLKNIPSRNKLIEHIYLQRTQIRWEGGGGEMIHFIDLGHTYCSNDEFFIFFVYKRYKVGEVDVPCGYLNSSPKYYCISSHKDVNSISMSNL